jgi:hypothetical protein
LDVDLSVASGKPIEIINIQPHIERRDLGSPAWIYSPDDGCGSAASDRIFDFDLDAPTFKDVGAYVNPAAPPTSTDMPKEPLGPSFIVGGSHHARIRVDAHSCHGNYEWNLDVQYAPAGSKAIQHKIIGPFQSLG